MVNAREALGLLTGTVGSAMTIIGYFNLLIRDWEHDAPDDWKSLAWVVVMFSCLVAGIALLRA